MLRQFLVGTILLAASLPSAHAQDYRQAYIYALRCTVVANSAKDEGGARRAFDTAMKLGHIQKLSNRQLNADLAEWGATELVKITRDPTYDLLPSGACGFESRRPHQPAVRNADDGLYPPGPAARSL